MLLAPNFLFLFIAAFTTKCAFCTCNERHSDEHLSRSGHQYYLRVAYKPPELPPTPLRKGMVGIYWGPQTVHAKILSN